jgi:aspartyl/asparaginyl beta-hydroxylase (cupin superfamily)
MDSDINKENEGESTWKKEDSVKARDPNRHAKAFYSVREDFPQFKILEENWKEILNELIGVIEEERNEKIKNSLIKSEEESVFEPWVEKNLYQESNEDGWDVAPLMIGGSKIEQRCKKFPKLVALTDQLPGIMSISFSLLKPGTHIVPHKGYDDYSERVLRYHLGLVVPKGDIGIRVEREIRGWEPGKSWIFDDYLIHEAWNFTDKNRLVLIIDFLRDTEENAIFQDKNFNNSIKNYFK